MDRRRFLFATGSGLAGVTGTLWAFGWGKDSDLLCPWDCSQREIQLSRRDGDGQWPQAHRDERNTSYAPGSTVSESGISPRWRTDRAEYLDAPVVSGDVFASIRVDSESVLQSLDPADGQVNWRVPFEEIYSQPAVDSDSVHVLAEDADGGAAVVTLDRTSGQERWRVSDGITGGDVDTSMSLAGEHLYVPTDTGVVAVDRIDRSVQWRASLGPAVVSGPDGPTRKTTWATPGVARDHVVSFDVEQHSGSTRTVFGIDRDTGDVDWTRDLPLGDGWKLAGPAVIGSDHALVLGTRPVVRAEDSGGSGESPPGDRLLALDPATGQIAWREDLQSQAHWPPAVADRYLFVGRRAGAADGGRLSAIDLADRSIAWSHTFSNWGGRDPVLTSDSVVVQDDEGLTALDVRTGRRAWRRTFQETVSRHTVADDTVYALRGRPRSAMGNRIVALR